MISGGVVGWEKAEDVLCSSLCKLAIRMTSSYYKMIMQDDDTPARYEQGVSVDLHHHHEGKKKILQQQKMTIEKMNSAFIYSMKVVL